MTKSLEDLYALLEKVSKNQDDIKADISVIKDELNITSQKLEAKIVNLVAENDLLKQRVLTCERIQKKNNIIIYGLQFNNASVLDAVIQFVKDKLNIQLHISDIDDCYQLSKEDSKPVILLKLIAHLKKSEIFKNLSKLKDTGVSFVDDLPFGDREERKLLYNHFKKAKAENIPAKIFRNKIFIAGTTYTVADLKEQDSHIFINSEDEAAGYQEKQPSKQISLKRDKKKPNQLEPTSGNKISTRNQQMKNK